MKHITKADLDDMIFEDRERDYGAYVLRKQYPWTLMWAILMVTGLGISATGVLVFWANASTQPTAKPVLGKLVFVRPPAPPLPPPVKYTCRGWGMIQDQVPGPEPEDRISSPIDTLVSAPNLDQFWDDDEADLNLGDEEIPEGASSFPNPQEFILVDEEPVPINLMEVMRLITYPQMARDAGISGHLVFRVLVDKHGNYVRHLTITSIHPLVDREVERHLPKLRFLPAQMDGHSVPFWMNIPVRICFIR